MSDKTLRSSLIHLASDLPKGRDKLAVLELLAGQLTDSAGRAVTFDRNGHAHIVQRGRKYFLADVPGKGEGWYADPEGWALSFDNERDLQATLPHVPTTTVG